MAHVAYRLGPDSTGEPSIFFRILLSDPYIREDTIADLTGRIATILSDAVRPLARELGLTAILQSSEAYYAVFHFLISEATSNWSNASLRTALGRACDHGVMRTLGLMFPAQTQAGRCDHRGS